MKNVSIEIETKNGGKHSMDLRIPAGDVRPSDLVAPSQRLFDKIIELELEGEKITCRKGCGACCRQLIPLSIPEAFYLSDRILSLPRERRVEIRRKFDSIESAMNHVESSGGFAHPSGSKNIDEIYFELGIPCPFLQNEQCGIYEHRPFVCRDFHVASPEENCKDPYHKPLKRIKIERNVGSLLAAYSFRLYNMPKIPVPLSRVSDWATEHKALSAAKWPSAAMFDTIIGGLNRAPCRNSNIVGIRIKTRSEAFGGGGGERETNTRPETGKEREKRMPESAFAGDAEQLARRLGLPGEGSIIDAVDREGRSGLFIALSRGYAATNPGVISAFLQNGATIENGAVIVPDQLPKLLTQHANARIIRRIFKDFFGAEGKLLQNDLILEVGSGRGYLKYLLSLASDPGLAGIHHRIVETESSSDIVRRNAARGKSTIRGAIRDLPELFGKSFTPCVVSLNVMDTFSPRELIMNTRAVHELLREDGVLLHLMSSAIHPDIFREIEAAHPGDMLFPYYREGRLGLRMVSTDHGGEPPFTYTPPPENPCDMFIRNPDEYVRLANSVTEMIERNRLDDRTILFKDHFIRKITDAFHETGFRLIYNDLATASAIVKRNRFHDLFPGFDKFENIMGVLIPGSADPPRLQPDEVEEKSTFLVVAGQKMRS